MLRVVHFGAQVIATVFSNEQNIVWFTDSDPIVANEEHKQLFGRFAEATIRMFMPQESINRIVFGLSEIDGGSLEIEDFIAIPDLVAGALCETLDQLSQRGIRVTPGLALNRPKVKEKTNIICAWIGQTACPLKKFGIAFDKLGPDTWDFRPTLFTIQNPNVAPCEVVCNAQFAAAYVSDPIRFDVEESSRDWTKPCAG